MAGVDVDLGRGCLVVAGRNGAGKSQLLREIKSELGERAVLVELHRLCEQVRAVLGSRTDIADMEDETGPLPIASDIESHIHRVVGRDYDGIEWFALDLGPSEGVTDFVWSEAQPLVPHFKVRYRAREYSTLGMGLGELSVHILFWILEQYRDEPGLTLLLDEPDAYLPPIGSARLLARVQDLCVRRRWNLIMSTHSEEMIRAARMNDGLMVLRRDSQSGVEALCSWTSGPDIAAELLAPDAVDLVLFCEDESAAALTRSLLRHAGQANGVSVVWKDGAGYLTSLGRHLPAYSGMDVHFAVVYDGDQRGKEGRPAVSSGWTAVFLPTAVDPDHLFKSLGSEPVPVAARLSVAVATVQSWFDALEGADAHDWVNGVGVRYGNRTEALHGLADVWVAAHGPDAADFCSHIESLRSR